MFKKMIKKVQGFTPVELVLVVGLGALIAGALVFMATAPQYMAGQPINVNIKLDGVTASRTPVAMAKQEEAETVVVGQNNPAIDVGEVQAAVNNGGTVLLKGTFDFGAEGSVEIRNDVEILGETDNEGNPLTVINGGFHTFYAPLYVDWVYSDDPTVPSHGIFPDGWVPGAGPKLTIQGIHFTGATLTPILVNYSSGLNIHGNKIDNVIPLEKYMHDGNVMTINAAYDSIGIHIGARHVPWGCLGSYLEGAVTGNIKITDNVIDMYTDPEGDYPPDSVMGFGILGMLMNDITVTLSGNILTNASRSNLQFMDIITTEGISTVLLENNHIETSEEGIFWPTTSAPNGLVIGGYFMPADPNTKYIITKNYVETRGANLTTGASSGGIMVLANDTIVKGNHIVIGGRPTNRGIYVMGSDSLIANNKIEGSGQTAYFLYPNGGRLPDNNVFVGNNTNNFAGLTALIYYTAKYNTFVGGGGTVAPLGPFIDDSNVFTGLNVGTTPGDVGDAVSAEMSSWQKAADAGLGF